LTSFNIVVLILASFTLISSLIQISAGKTRFFIISIGCCFDCCRSILTNSLNLPISLFFSKIIVGSFKLSIRLKNTQTKLNFLESGGGGGGGGGGCPVFVFIDNF